MAAGRFILGLIGGAAAGLAIAAVVAVLNPMPVAAPPREPVPQEQTDASARPEPPAAGGLHGSLAPGAREPLVDLARPLADPLLPEGTVSGRATPSGPSSAPVERP